MFEMLLLAVVVLLTSAMCTVVHEFGHAVAGRMGGLPVLNFRLWSGKPILRFTLLGVSVEVGRVPIGGKVSFLDRGVLAKITSDPAYAHLQKRLADEPHLNEELAARLESRHLSWMFMMLAGPVLEATFVFTMLYVLPLDRSAAQWQNVMWCTLAFHTVVALGNLAPIFLTGAMDGFVILLHFWLWLRQRAGYAELDENTAAKRLSWVSVFGVMYILAVATVFIKSPLAFEFP